MGVDRTFSTMSVMLVEKPLRRSRKYTSCGEKLINLVLHLDFIFYSF